MHQYHDKQDGLKAASRPVRRVPPPAIHTRLSIWAAWLLLAAGLAGTTGCGALRQPASSRTLYAPLLRETVNVDGHLDESCYRNHPPLTRFTLSCSPRTPVPPTRSWVFWEPERLVFAFDITDPALVAAPESGRKYDVGKQDRGELFLWSGNPGDAYYCFEIGARGALLDYSAHFYRKFDYKWSLKEIKLAVIQTVSGYCIEGEIPRSAMETMGFPLRPGARIRCGLFRADFRPGEPETPDWICWVDARERKPDFHVAQSFGTLVLEAPASARSAR